ncbi:MAG: hypothetical protein RR550_00175 [Rikenellaceae bacterium]
MRLKPTLYIGIDTGTNTGLAQWDCTIKQLTVVRTLKIHEALSLVKDLHTLHGDSLFVRFEDARLRKWFAKAGREKLQGAGSIKRDCVIWQEFLTDNRIYFEAVAPRDNMTKLPSDVFKKMTGWKGKTSEHSRDAAMLVFNYK